MCEQVAPTNNEDLVYKVYKYYKIFDIAYSKLEDALKVENENGKHKDQVQEIFIILKDVEQLEWLSLIDFIPRYNTDYDEIIETYTTEYVRICSECEDYFDEGYLIDDGSEYFCSDVCLHKNYTEQEYLEMYNDDVAYWTTFF